MAPVVSGFSHTLGHELVHKRAKVAFRHQCRIQIAHGPGRGVAGICEKRLAGVLELAVDALEGGSREVDLAADLDPRGWSAAERERNRTNGADVRGHLVAARAVAPRGAAEQPSLLIGERDAQAVDLELGDVRHGCLAEPAGLPDPLVERTKLAFVVRVVEAEHRRHVLDRLEALHRTAGDALGRRVGGNQVRMVGFDLLELVEEPIEFLVGDFGVVVDVVALFVTADRLTKLFETLFWRCRHRVARHVVARNATLVQNFVITPTR